MAEIIIRSHRTSSRSYKYNFNTYILTTPSQKGEIARSLHLLNFGYKNSNKSTKPCRFSMLRQRNGCGKPPKSTRCRSKNLTQTRAPASSTHHNNTTSLTTYCGMTTVFLQTNKGNDDLPQRSPRRRSHGRTTAPTDLARSRRSSA